MSRRIDCSIEARAQVLVYIEDRAPEDLFTRAEDVEGFQKHLYGDSVRDKQTVLEHWAYNALVNNVQDASRLDGWGDLERGMVEFRVVDASIEDLGVDHEGEI